MFKVKTLLITGGTGTFGNAVLRRFLETEIHEIRIFSRDEKKQNEMRLFRKKKRDLALPFNNKSTAQNIRVSRLLLSVISSPIGSPLHPTPKVTHAI